MNIIDRPSGLISSHKIKVVLNNSCLSPFSLYIKEKVWGNLILDENYEIL